MSAMPLKVICTASSVLRAPVRDGSKTAFAVHVCRGDILCPILQSAVMTKSAASPPSSRGHDSPLSGNAQASALIDVNPEGDALK